MPLRGELSVFRIDGLSDQPIWAIGNEIEILGARTLHARADLHAHVVRKNDLDILASEPPARHSTNLGKYSL